MTPIERHLRTAIIKASAESPEARNHLYLAARKSILQLPPEKKDTVLNQLFVAVKTIETEYAQRDIELHGSTAFPKQRPTAVNALLRKFRTLKSYKGQIITVAIVLAITFFSLQLLISQFQSQPDGSQNNISANNNGAMVRHFVAAGKKDIPILAANVQGTSPVVATASKSSGDELWFGNKVRLYGKQPVKIKPNQYYLMRLKLRYEPSDTNVKLNAGLANLDNTGATVNHSKFLHSGWIRSKHFQSDSKTYFFSRIINQDDLEGDLDLSNTDGMATPFVIASAKNKNTKIQIVSMTVDELP